MYASYHNEARTHLSLGKDAPISRTIERFGRIIAEPMVGGLHHRYARIQFSVGTGLALPNRRRVRRQLRMVARPDFTQRARVFGTLSAFGIVGSVPPQPNPPDNSKELLAVVFGPPQHARLAESPWNHAGANYCAMPLSRKWS